MIFIILLVWFTAIVIVGKFGDGDCSDVDMPFEHCKDYILSSDVQDGKYDSATNLSINEQKAVRLIKMLIDIETPMLPFQLKVTDKKPKTIAGYYWLQNRRIIVHSGWGQENKTAIHEYSHHKHLSELRGHSKGQKNHGKEFWAINNKLKSIAIRKGYKL